MVNLLRAQLGMPVQNSMAQPTLMAGPDADRALVDYAQAIERKRRWDELTSALSETWPARVAQSVASGFTAPRDAYVRGMATDEMVSRGQDLSNLVFGGGLVAARPAGSVGMGGRPEAQGIRAFHSSPHDFDRFDLSKVGTGTGEQLYGHGIYLADDAARSDRGGAYWKRFLINMPAGPEKTAAGFLLSSKFDTDRALAELTRAQKNLASGAKSGVISDADYRLALAEYRQASSILKSGAPVGPRTYEVDIRTDPSRILDWERLAAQQPEQFRALLNATNTPTTATTGEAYKELARVLGGAPQASEAMRQSGFSGVRHLNPRAQKGDGSGRDYVIFDDSVLNILRKYGLLGSIGGGAAVNAISSTPEGM